MVDLKTCSKCRESKPHAEFYRDKQRKDGLTYQCKNCRAANLRYWQHRNPDKCSAYSAAFRRAYPEKVREMQARWVDNNPDKVKAYSVKRSVEERKRAYRYARALKYFEGRPGWVSLITACLLREKRLRSLEWVVPSLADHLSTQEI